METPSEPSATSSPGSRGQADAPQVIEAVSQVRAQLALELHDTVCQTLTAAYFHAKYLETQLGESTPEVAAAFAGLGDEIHGASEELRALIARLRAVP